MPVSAAKIAETELAASVATRIFGIKTLARVILMVKRMVRIMTEKTNIDPFCLILEVIT